jgi:hypothetical protein
LFLTFHWEIEEKKVIVTNGLIRLLFVMNLTAIKTVIPNLILFHLKTEKVLKNLGKSAHQGAARSRPPISPRPRLPSSSASPPRRASPPPKSLIRRRDGPPLPRSGHAVASGLRLDFKEDLQEAVRREGGGVFGLICRYVSE